ncbi:MAG: hypothetical protein QM756_34410 [Polyangiaceae bacterium]
MPNVTSAIVDQKLLDQANAVFRQKQVEFHDALKARGDHFTDAAAHNLETISAYSVGVTCKIFTIAMAGIWGQIFAHIQYPDGTKLTFRGEGWGIGLGGGAGGGGGPATNQSSNLLGKTPFECQFTPIQATAVFYKPDGVACTLIVGGAYPGTAGYLKGSGNWELGWT